jgi:hypothetical protein
MPEHEKPQLGIGFHQPCHGFEERRRALLLTELAVDTDIAELGSVGAPLQWTTLGVRLRCRTDSGDIQFRAVR